ncbi:MAG: helix-turn-helix transcriptional regulator [Saprospiraceae bacterium]
MQIEITDTQPQKWVSTIAKYFDLPVHSNCMEETLLLAPPLGAGKITGFGFSGGLGILLLYCTLEEDWELLIQQAVPALQFNFCVAGNIRHFLQNKEIQYQLMPLQGSITANKAGYQESIFLPARTELIFTHLVINRAAYLNRIDCLVNETPPELSNVFKDVAGDNTFLYQSNYSLAIAEIIKRIISDKNEGLVRSALIEGKTLELLSKQIKQYSDDLQLPDKQVVLRQSDVATIEAARDILIANLKTPPTIEELARQTGINRQKLKSGFKIVFDRTIHTYLREYRLETAAALLLSGKSAGEVAMHVGYVNQSHFARLFKEKYGVLPKDYLKTIQHRIQHK